MKLVAPGLGLIFWMTIVFLILLFILGKYGWPVVLKMLSEREQRIKDSLNAAAKAKEEMIQQHNLNKKILEEAKAERDAIIKSARQAGERIVKETTLEAQAQAQIIIEDTRRKMEEERRQAMQAMNRQIVDLSILISETVLSQELSDREKAKQEIAKRIQEMHLS